MIWVTTLIMCAVIVVSALYGYKKWGASDEKKKQAKRIVKDMEKDAEIASKPYTDKPFSRMRRKK
jgi:hypothetical protein